MLRIRRAIAVSAPGEERFRCATLALAHPGQFGIFNDELALYLHRCILTAVGGHVVSEPLRLWTERSECLRLLTSLLALQHQHIVRLATGFEDAGDPGYQPSLANCTDIGCM